MPKPISLVKAILPPIIIQMVRAAIDFPRRNRLFGGDDAVFKREAKKCRVYGEYGCGASTIWMAQNTSVVIYSVDSSKMWLEHVDSKVQSDKLISKHVDMGELGAWGYPLGYRQRAQFKFYLDFIWTRSQKPDLVLIDGRFRVACFLTSLKHAETGTYLFFDDYRSRPEYAVVEEFLAPSEYCGRQAIFIVPARDEIDMSKLEIELERFRYVMA